MRFSSEAIVEAYRYFIPSCWSVVRIAGKIMRRGS